MAAVASSGHVQQMTTAKEELWKSLEHLTDEYFKQFKWFLKQDDDDSSAIPASQLERADRQDTVDLMVQTYGPTKAWEVTMKVLEKINRNDLVLNLKDLKISNSPQNDFENQKNQLKAELQLNIEKRQMKIREIERSADLRKTCAERQISHSVKVFTELVQSFERSLSVLIETVEEPQRTKQKQTDGFIQELKEEISQLTRQSSEVGKLPYTKQNLNYLQSLSPSRPIRNSTDASVPLPSHEEHLRTASHQLKENLSAEMEELLAKFNVHWARQFAVDVTLDSSTASPHLMLSDDGKQVHCGDVEQKLPDNPSRFNPAPNVLGKQSFSSGRFYYEVTVNGKTSWDVGVVKESINRKGRITAGPPYGYWTICLRSGDKYKASAVNLSVKGQPGKVGVFVDYDQRLVSFYDVDSADLIYSFKDCSFKEKLHPFFSPGPPHRGQNSTPLIISPVSDAVI